MAPKKRSILFVCSGNTCRSPMAAAYMRKICAEKGVEDIEILSAGISAIDGACASPNSIVAAREAGLDLSSHRSRALTPELIRSSDMIIAMTEAQRGYAMELARPREKSAFKLLLDFDPESPGGELPDPYGGGVEIYRQCLLKMMPALDNLLTYLENRKRKDRYR